MSLVSQDSAVQLHSEYKGHSSKEASVHILGREDRLQENVCVHKNHHWTEVTAYYKSCQPPTM